MRALGNRRVWCVAGVIAFCLSLSSDAFATCGAPANAIEAENCKPGNPDAEWDIDGAGDPSIQGFATDISFNVGSTANFKIKTDATAYTIEVYRMGYYSGMGARKVATISPSAALPQVQPACVFDSTVGLGGSGLYDCGNWAVSASWPIPSDATSGIYFALLKRSDTGGKSHIVFVVRNDASHSDLLFQTSDLTWQAYNNYGGGSLYGSSNIDIGTRSFKVSYNRPFVTRETQAHNWLFTSEYPMVRWLEANGYDVSYFSGVDTARFPARLLQHKTFLSVGHDEYWSGDQRANVEAARAAGVNLAFFSGNEVFWKTRWENSIDGSSTAFRTLVSYKETHANAKIDPATNVWTGTWRDPRFSPPADGGRPENSLTGTLFMINGANFGSIQIPAADGKMRFWRNTSVAGQTPGQVAVLPDGTLGFEWDIDADNGARPPGLFHLSTATYTVTDVFLLDFGSNYGAGTATHHLTLYRAPSGALVFGAGTINWAWGLDDVHDAPNFPAFPVDVRMQQATVNLFADMEAQPATLQAGLTTATKSSDATAPASTITAPTSGASVQVGNVLNFTGTAADQGGGVVGGVEISTDGGTTWHPAVGRESWSYSWTTNTAGTFSILTRAVDDSGNLETPSAGINVTVTCPCSVMSGATVPTTIDSGDPQGVEVGVKFRSDVNGFITGIRFYKAATNTGTHVGHLWTKDGTLLATATFTSETASGWQQVTFPTAVAVNAGTTYVASYHAPNGHYSLGLDYFAFTGVDSPPLHLLKNGIDGPNGVFSYGPSGTFPTASFRSSNYYVDVVLVTGTITSVSPTSGAFAVSNTTTVSATFEKALNPASVTSSSFQLLDPANNPIAASVAYDPSTRIATLTPSSALEAATTYTAFIGGTTGGITDSSGNPLGLNYSWRFTTCCSVWSTAVTPGVADSGDTAAVEVGVKFRSDVNGFITGLRFYKSTPNTGTHVGHLWTRDGTLLSSATFTSESASGWQQVNFPTAIAITAGTTYIASYFAPNGRYAVGVDAFATSGVDSPPLHILKDGDDGGNGVFSYGPNGTFPTSSFRSSNYWVDVIFTTNVGGLSGPNVTSIVPGSGAIGVSIAATVNAAFNKALDPATVNNNTFKVIDAAGDPVPALVSYEAETSTATLTPIFGFDYTNSYRAIVTGGAAGVKDTLGHPMALSVLWPFAVQAAPTGSCPCSGLGTANPAVPDSGDSSAVEVGVKFRSTVNGFVTGLRFYKSAPNTGTHVGHLWTRDGKLLSSATFSSETASGWQQVSFPTAIAITAGTTYVASYFAPNGHYAVGLDAFASAGIDSPPIHFLKDGEDGGNGVFSAGASGTFPTSTFRSSNYYVDIVFVTSVGGAFGPTVTTVSPSSAATGVNITAAINATFDKDLDPATVNGSTLQLLDSTNNPIAATVTYDAPTRTATLTPSVDLNLASSYRPLVVGRTSGVKDAAGHPMRSSVQWLFTTAPTPAGSCPCSVWSPSTLPPNPDSADPAAIEVGVRFRSDVNGFISGIRFYKSAGNTGTHVGNLWKTDGTLLSSATFTNETASGWQQVNFPTAVAINAGTTYIASYFAPNGHYSVGDQQFAAAGVDNPPLHLLQDGLDGANGLFDYSATSKFPTSTFRSRNYWVDVVFDTGVPRPVVATTSPANGDSGVSPATSVTAIFATAMDPATINSSTFLLLDQFNAVVPATVTYDNATNTATLTPNVPLAGSASYQAVLKGGNSNPRVKNLNGQSFLTDYQWSFSTATQLISVTLDASTVIGGNQVNGTVTLRVPAPAGGTSVALSSNNSAVASVPASVTVAAGATSATFAVTTTAVTSNTPVNITATLDTVKTAALTVTPPPLSTLVLSPTSVFSRGTSTGTITLSAAAPTGGSTIALASDNAAATVPASVTIAAGATTGTFTVTTSDVSVSTNVNVTATLNGVKTAALTVNPYTVTNLVLTPTAVISGASSTGTVTLNAAAPTGGVAVALASNNPAATVPASVTVAAGATTGTFTVNTVGVTSSTPVTITATLNGAKTAALTVNPATLNTLTLSPTSVVSGNTATGTVTLTGVAPAGGALITLSDANPAATVPASVTIAAGATSATFTVTTIGVSANATGAVSAVYAGVTRTANLTVTPAAITSLALNPATVVGPASSTATVTLNGDAPPGGALVTLSSANAAATVPASVTVAVGARTATFTVTTVSVANATTGNISGTYRGTTRSANLTVNPLFASITLTPASVVGGSSSTGRVNLAVAAPAGGILFTLSSANPAATVPANVTVPAGATTATFTVTTVPVNGVTTGNVTASDGSTTRSANLNVNPPALSSIGRSPASVVGGNPITGTATLTGPAGPSGAVVTLTTTNIGVVVPASVTVPAGATSVTFTISTIPVEHTSTGTVSGTYLGVTRTSASITVNEPTLSSLTLNPTTVKGGNPSTGTVTLTGVAAVNITVAIASNNDPVASVPATVIVPAGSRTGTFTVTTFPRTTTSSPVISATYFGLIRNATLTVTP